MKIFLDSDFLCHIENDGTMLEVETNAFTGLTKAYIEGYRYIPEGKSWERSDGVVFNGLMIAPAKDYKQIMLDVAIGFLDDEQAENVFVLFPVWEVNKYYETGDRRQYNGLLYRCVQAHTSQDDWTPDKTPALWVRTWTDPFPEWVQPTGAHDAYAKGSHVSHNSKHWESEIDANVYEPGVYGWIEVN